MGIFLWGMLLLLAGSMMFLNLFRYTVQMDSDIAAEGLNARAIWEYQSLIPQTFYHSSETRILNVNLIGAVMYGITGNMNLSMGIACCVMLALLLGCYGWLLRKTGFERVELAASLVLLLAFSGNLRHAQILYLWAAYYAIHCILMLISLIVWLNAVHGSGGWKLQLPAAVLLAFLIGLSGMRGILICYAPLFLTEVLRWLSCLLIQKQIDRAHLRSGLCAALLLAGTFLGSRLPTSVGVSTSRNIRHGFSKLCTEVFPDAWECLVTGAENPFRKVLILIFLGLTVGSVGTLAFSYGKRKWAKHQEKAPVLIEETEKGRDRRRVLLFFAVSWLVSVLMGTFTTTDSVWRYYFMSYFLLSYGTVCMGKEWKKRAGGIIRPAVFALTFLFSVLTWQQEVLPFLRDPAMNEEYEEITAWMQENGIRYGYSTYDSANAMTVSCNGAVQISAVANLGTMEICKWLTDKNWYVPQLPVEMETAYIIPTEKTGEFQSVLEQHDDIKQALQTEQYTVYVSPHNYTTS